MCAQVWNGQGAWSPDYHQHLVRLAAMHRQGSTPAGLLKRVAGMAPDLEPTADEIVSEQNRLAKDAEGRSVSAAAARLAIISRQSRSIIEADSPRELSERMAGQPEAVGQRPGIAWMTWADTRPEPAYSGDPQMIASIREVNRQRSQLIYERQQAIGRGYRMGDDGRPVAGVPTPAGELAAMSGSWAVRCDGCGREESGSYGDDADDGRAESLTRHSSGSTWLSALGRDKRATLCSWHCLADYARRQAASPAEVTP